MHRIAPYLMVACITGLGLFLVLLASVLQHLTTNHIVTVGERENLSLMRVLANTDAGLFGDGFQELQILDNHQLRQHPSIRLGEQWVRKAARGSPLLQLGILADNGHMVFSTDQNQLGRNHAGETSFLGAKAGQVISRLEHRQVVNSMDGIQLERDVLITRLPLKKDVGVPAVYELQTDVTDVARVAGQAELFVMAFMAAGYVALVLMLLAGARSVNRRIASQAALIHKQAELIEHKSLHDPLTGLPNRELFYRQLQDAMQDVHDSERLLAVLAVNLSRLQKINDTLGFRFGDALLLETAQRLRQCVRKGDTIGWLSGGRFVVILREVTIVEQVDEVAEQILKAVSEPYWIEGYELFLLPSTGISLYPFAPDDDADSLIKMANAAMYKAFQSGRDSCHYYNPVITKQAASRFSIENALRNALQREEFELHYQPIALLKTRRIYGVEALLRWRSPEFGLVPPLDFIPLLEETGLIRQVGSWVLEQACRQAVRWREQGLGELSMHVNVSAVQFLQKEIVRQVHNALDRTGIAPHLLDLEITESLLIDGAGNAIETLETLKETGVSLSIDDFGTGYSSLAYLKRLPIDTLKIDRSFIREVPRNFDDTAIMNAICALSRSLRFKVVVEGVETAEQLLYSCGLGISGAQGYLFSKPLPPRELEPLLRRGLEEKIFHNLS